VLGFENGLSPQTQIHLLDNQNNAFEIIESLLRVYLSPIEYNTSDPFAPIDTEAEQVWLFAMRWLEHYYECLMEPLAIRTEFYKQSHTKFLDLMRKMLAYNPKKRISFNDALKIWYPSSTVFSVHPLNEQDSLSMTDPTPLGIQGNPRKGDMKATSSAECHNPLPSASSVCHQPLVDTQAVNSAECCSPPPLHPLSSVAAHDPVQPVESSVSVSNTVLPSASEPSSAPPAVTTAVTTAATSARSRLALKRSDGPEGHNKTRRSPRNSGRSPAIGNRGTRVRG
jgi:serine/threonine protein kinase